MRELGVQSPVEYALHPNRVRERTEAKLRCFFRATPFDNSDPDVFSLAKTHHCSRYRCTKISHE